MRRDLAEEPKSVRLVSSLFVLAGETQGARCAAARASAPRPASRYASLSQNGPQRLPLIRSGETGRSTASFKRGIASALRFRERIGVAQSENSLREREAGCPLP